MTAGRGNNVIHQWRETPRAAAGCTLSLDNDVCSRKVTWTLTEQKKITVKFDNCVLKELFCLIGFD